MNSRTVEFEIQSLPMSPTTPSPGETSKFLTVPFFYQCDALVQGGKPCEKIFSSFADAQTHNKSDHGLNDYYYGQTLHIDADKNLYIL